VQALLVLVAQDHVANPLAGSQKIVNLRGELVAAANLLLVNVIDGTAVGGIRRIPGIVLGTLLAQTNELGRFGGAGPGIQVPDGRNIGQDRGVQRVKLFCIEGGNGYSSSGCHSSASGSPSTHSSRQLSWLHNWIAG